MGTIILLIDFFDEDREDPGCKSCLRFGFAGVAAFTIERALLPDDGIKLYDEVVGCLRAELMTSKLYRYAEFCLEL